jgi:DNA primase
LREGHSFHFAFLPQGQDPDDLVRGAGPGAFADVLKASRPLIDMLWLRERQAVSLDTPERRAAFEERLERLLGEIGNTRVKDHYRREVKNRLFELWRARPSPGTATSPRIASRPSDRRKVKPLPSAYGFATIVALALVNHPWLLDRFADEVATLEVRDKPLSGLLGFVTRTISEAPGMAREPLIDALSQSAHAKLFDRLLRESPFKRVAFIQPESPASEVGAQFAELLYRCRALPTLNRELTESADHLAEMSEAEFERFAALQQQVASVGLHHEADDAGERDANKRFQETVARLKGERLERGRRHVKQSSAGGKRDLPCE